MLATYSSGTKVLAAVIVTMFWGLCQADCPGDGTGVTDYVQIDEPYDRNYSSITSTGKHPLGFYQGILYYNQQGMTNPCIKVTGASGRRLEIKVETVPRMKLCVKDQASDETCFEGRYTDCRETPANIVYIEFLCNSECEEADVLFWYRLTLSAQGEDPEQFCFSRDSKYPEDLFELPPGVTLPTYTTPGAGPTGAGSSLQPWTVFVVLLALCQTVLGH